MTGQECIIDDCDTRFGVIGTQAVYLSFDKPDICEIPLGVDSSLQSSSGRLLDRINRHRFTGSNLIVFLHDIQDRFDLFLISRPKLDTI